MPDAPLFPPVRQRTLVGTGLSQDFEEIEELQNEMAQHDRATRKAPKKKFKQVLREKAQELASREEEKS